MNKRGVVEWLFFWTFYLVLVILIFLTLYSYLQDVSQNRIYNENFLARDVALFIDTIYDAPGDVSASYPITKQEYDSAIGKFKDGYYVKVKYIDGSFYSEYPYAENLYSGQLKALLGEGYGINAIDFNKYENGFILQGDQGVNVKLDSFELQRIQQANFIWPLDKKVVTSCFGFREVNEGSKYHKAIDLRASKGTSVKAIKDGIVKQIIPNIGEITIDAGNGIIYSYIHLDSWSVKEKDKITKGQIIGKSGDSGTNQEHLHLEIIMDGNYVDPLKFYDLKDISFSRSSNCYYNVKNYPEYTKYIQENAVA
ncbi:MAG: M23 family metallopeptidase [Candidatus Woesearchaeota archaeon]